MRQSVRLSLALAAGGAVVSLCPAPAMAVTDWDLYSLKLVNRARTDPAGEAARIGSSTVDNSAPLPALGYQLLVEQAATNHNNWMFDNLGNLPQSTLVPDSFTHSETVDGKDTGAAATGTPSYTGADPGARLTAAGYTWSSYAENIAIAWSTGTNAFTINQARVDAYHKGWWESAPHRADMLSANNTTYGVHFDARAITAQQSTDANFGSSTIRSVTIGTEDYSRPLSGPMRYIGGLFFHDLDASGGWNPHATGPTQEGLAGVSYQILNQSTSAVVASGVTSAVGSFATPVANGTYKLALALPNGTYTVQNITLNGNNIILPDIERAVVSAGSILNVAQLPDPVLTLNGRGIVKPTSSGGLGVNSLTSLTINAGGALDLNDNKLILRSAGATGSWNGSAYTGVTGQLQSGYNGGAWDGSGIVTSMPAATSGHLTTLGVATAAQVKGIANSSTASWAGQTVTGSDTLVMYTYGGDANLDGKINVDDYTRIDFNVALGTKGWYNGDFNYDGKINVDDYTIIDFNVGIQGAPFSSAGGAGSANGAPLNASAVPEPSTLMLACLCIPAIAWRRRRVASSR